MENFHPQSLCSKDPFSNFSAGSHFWLKRHGLVSFSEETQIQNSIICARNKKRQFGSARSRKLVLQSAYQIASKLKILPEPLDLLIKEFGIGGGNGSGFGSWKGSGWGGFDGWGGRRKKRMLEFWGILVIFGLGFSFILGKELDSGVLLGSLGLVLFGLSVDGWRSGMKDWALGFCCCAFLVGLVLKKEDFQKWAKSFGSMKLLHGKLLGRKKRGRVF